jgi:hypothetical protein
MTTYPPTPEQAAAIEAFGTGDDLVIQAGAGTGKTSTLRMLAEAAPRRRGLYVAFNKAIAGDAKRSFPRNVEAATAHSLAFRAVGYQYRERLDGPRVPARIAAQILGITGPTHIGDDVPILAPQQMARIVMGTVARFARSADREPIAAHVPPTTCFDTPAQRRALAAEILPLARRAWQDLTAPRGRLKFTHDHYLKLWQLSYPILPCEFVLFDEAQDADPVIMSIIGRQPSAQRIVVGDSAQAIYEWRGAIDALAKFTGKRLTLSKSFRFGPAVANEANRWLDELDAPLRLEGHEPIPSRIVDQLGEPDAILCRSNAGAMTQVMTALAQGRRVALVGGGKNIRDLAAAAVALKAGAPCDHPELFAFRTWSEVQDYCLVPGTRVLTRDLRWQPIELLGPGDELVAFDEQKQPGTMGRRFRTATVEHTETITRPCLKVTLSDGSTVTASAEHRWLVYSGHNLRWTSTAALLIGTRLPSLGTWEEDPSRDARWLAGMFDGEGYVGGAYANSRSRYLSVGQKEGPVLEQLRVLLKERGFTFVDRARKDGVHQLDIKGGLPDWLRLLGSLRPIRLLPKARLLYEDIRIERIRDLRVTAIETVGPQDVIALRTDRRTFIAEGLFSHNCAMDEGGSDLRAMVKLIDDYGPDALISAVDRLVDEPSDTGNKPMALTTAKPDVIVSTAHKAKGREWASVLIGEDFYPPKIDETGEQKEAEPGELRLAYVAVTRARLVLDRGSLRWLDAYRRQLPIPAPQPAPAARETVTASSAPSNASSASQPPADGPRCPDCDAATGQPHGEGCDVARCTVTGNQRLSCDRINHDCGNQIWTGPSPAQPPPSGIYCGPGGRIAPEDFDDYLRQRKELGDHYSQLLAATTPGTRDYTRIADERATKLRQLADDYEHNADKITKELA